MSEKLIGSSIDDFLKEECIFQAAQEQAIEEVLAYQLSDTTKRNISKKNGCAVEDQQLD